MLEKVTRELSPIKFEHRPNSNPRFFFFLKVLII